MNNSSAPRPTRMAPRSRCCGEACEVDIVAPDRGDRRSLTRPDPARAPTTTAPELPTLGLSRWTPDRRYAMRKLVLGVLFAALALAGCGGSSHSTSTATSATAPSTDTATAPSTASAPTTTTPPTTTTSTTTRSTTTTSHSTPSTSTTASTPSGGGSLAPG